METRKLLSHQGVAATTRLTQSWASLRCLPRCHKVLLLPYSATDPHVLCFLALLLPSCPSQVYMRLD